MRNTLFMLITVVLVAAQASAARAEEAQFSGQFCQGQSSGDRTQMLYNLLGAWNDDTSATHNWYCPMHWVGNLATADSIGATVNYKDYSSVDSLQCRISVVSSGGTNYLGPYVYSCSTAGGCPSANASYWSTSYQFLTLDVTHPLIGPYSWALQCIVPREASGNSWSGVIGYELLFTPF